MPNPKTIEELLKMDAYPFREKQIVSADDWKIAVDKKRLGLLREYNKDRYIGFEFFMPPNGYYLPPDKQIGLPLGEWTLKELKPLIDILPFWVIRQYSYDNSVASDEADNVFFLVDFNHPYKNIIIHKQPPSLYNPLDQQVEEVLMENNSANEAQPAKETEKMALPWQDISTLKDSDWDGMVLLYQPFSRHGINGYDYRMDSASHLKDNWEDVCKVGQWLPIPTPEAKTVEVPVEPERVSVQEFAKDPAGKWVNTSDGCPIKGWYQIQKEGEGVMGLPFKLWDIAKKDHPIYATDPTAWLAWKAEQEGNI